MSGAWRRAGRYGVAAACGLALPGVALAHDPAALAQALFALVVTAAAVRTALERWWIRSRRSPGGAGAGWWRLALLAIAEILLGCGFIYAWFAHGPAGAAGELVLAAAVMTALRLGLLRAFPTWPRALAASLVFPAVLALLVFTTGMPLYVLLGG